MWSSLERIVGSAPSASSSERATSSTPAAEKLFSNERQTVLTLSETRLPASRQGRNGDPQMRDASEGSRQDPSLAFRRSLSFPSAQTAVTCSAAETSAIIAISHPLKTAKPAVTNTRIFTMDSFPQDREPVEHLDRRTGPCERTPRTDFKRRSARFERATPLCPCGHLDERSSQRLPDRWTTQPGFHPGASSPGHGSP